MILSPLSSTYGSLTHLYPLAGEKARITAAGGFVDFGRVNGNLALSRAIGDFEFKKSAELAPEQQIVTAYPDVVVHDLAEDDEFLVIACDGEFALCSTKNQYTPTVADDSVCFRYLGLPILPSRHRVRPPRHRLQTGSGQDLREHDGQLSGFQLGDGWCWLRQHDHDCHWITTWSLQGRMVR